MSNLRIQKMAVLLAGLLPAGILAADNGANDKDPAREIIADLLAEYRATQVALQTKTSTSAPKPTEAPISERSQKVDSPSNGSAQAAADGRAADKAAPKASDKGASKSTTKPAPTVAGDKATSRTTEKAASTSREPAPLPDPTEIIRTLIESEKSRKVRDKRDAQKVFHEAQAAAKAGRAAEAVRLARRAQKLGGDNKEISEFIASIEKQADASKATNLTHARAAAHVAAGLTRGRELMRAGKYHEAVDLLLGVVQACLLFPENVSVDQYRRNAEEELAQYQAAVASQKITPAKAASAASESSSTGSVENAPPLNMRRISSANEGPVPAWYSRHKNLLNCSMTVEFRGDPIALALEDISEASGVQFVIDVPVSLARSHLNVPLNLRIADVPAEMILNIACMKSGLEYVIMEKAVVITTPNKAGEYVRQLPQLLRNNWVAAKVLFPELNPELLAATPARPASESDVNRDVPSYLYNGKALVQDVKKLLQ